MQWKLPVDSPAREAAHSYENWVDAVYGAMKELSTAMVADNEKTTVAEFAAPVVCDGSRVMLITTLADARMLVASSDDCRALK